MECDAWRQAQGSPGGGDADHRAIAAQVVLLQPAIRELQGLARQMDALRAAINRPRKAGHGGMAGSPPATLVLMQRVQEDPATLPRAAGTDRNCRQDYERPGRPSASRIFGSWSRLPEVPQLRHERPRSGPRGEHGIAAGGRQVRAGARLPIQHLRHLVDSAGDQPGHQPAEPDDPRSRPRRGSIQPGPQRQRTIDPERPPSPACWKRRKRSAGRSRRPPRR